MKKIVNIIRYIHGGFRVFLGVAAILWYAIGKNNPVEEIAEDINDALKGNPKGTTNLSGPPEDDPDNKKLDDK